MLFHFDFSLCHRKSLSQPYYAHLSRLLGRCLLLWMLVYPPTKLIAGEVPECYVDLVIVIDESYSMGRANMARGSGSDIKERRIKALLRLQAAIFEASEQASKIGQVVNVRYCVLKFGSEAKMVLPWTEIDSVKQQQVSLSNIRAENLGWTDYEKALQISKDAFQKLQFGKDPQLGPNGYRNLILLFLTDGEPSIQADHAISQSNDFWSKIESILNNIKNENSKFKLAMLVFHDPNSVAGMTFSSRTQAEWSSLNADIRMMNSGDSENAFYLKVEDFVDDYFYPTGKPATIPLNATGNFWVPCLLERISINVYLIDKCPPLYVISPSGKRYEVLKINDTHAAIEIDLPEPGSWKLEDYQSQKQNLDLRIQPLNPTLTYRYPDASLMLLKLPRKIRFDLDLSSTFATTTTLNPIGDCDIQATLLMDHNADDSPEFDVPMKSTRVGNQLQFESVGDYDPPVPATKLMIGSLTIKSHDQPILQMDKIPFQISDKINLVTPEVEAEVSFTGNKGTASCLIRFMHKGAFMKLDELFENPENAFQFSLVLPDKAPPLTQRDAQSGAWVAPKPVKLSRMNATTLRAELEMRYLEGDRPASWLSGLWRMIRRPSFKTGYQVRSMAAMKTKGEYLLLAPKAKP